MSLHETITSLARRLLRDNKHLGITVIMAFVLSFLLHGQLYAVNPVSAVIFPTKGATNVARQIDVVIHLNRPVDTTKLWCVYQQADSTRPELIRPAVLLIKKSLKDALPPHQWHQHALSGAFTVVNDSILQFSTPYLNYKTEYTVLVDSLRAKPLTTDPPGTNLLYIRDSSNFSIIAPAHTITGMSLDAKKIIRCQDTIMVSFNEPVTLSTPQGNLVNLKKSNSSGVFVQNVSITTWLDGTGTKVYIRPNLPYTLGETYQLTVNTHYLNGDTTTKNVSPFAVRGAYSIYTDVSIIGKPDSVAQLLNPHIYPEPGGTATLPGDTVRIFAQRVIGRYRFSHFTSSTDVSLNIFSNTNINYTQSCSELHNVFLTAVYQELPIDSVEFTAHAHSTLYIHRGDSTYSTRSTLVLPFVADSTDEAVVWCDPDYGYEFTDWTSNVVTYNGVLSPRVTFKMYPWLQGWNPRVFLNPRIISRPLIGDFAYSATVIVADGDQTAAGQVTWLTPQRHVTTTPQMRTISARAPDCYIWVSGGTISPDKKIITRTEMTSDPETVVAFIMERKPIALRVEQRIIVNSETEEPSDQNNVKWDGSKIFLKKANGDLVLLTGQITVKYEDAPTPKRKPYWVTKLRCNDQVVIDNKTLTRLDKNTWDHYQQENNYVTPVPLALDYWDALSLTEADAWFISADYPGVEEVRTRELFKSSFKLLEIGMNTLRKDGSFKFAYHDFAKFAKGEGKLDDEDIEAGNLTLQYSPTGIEVKLIFNKKLNLDSITLFSILSSTNFGIDNAGHIFFSRAVAQGGYTPNLIFNDEIEPNRFLYTYSLRNTLNYQHEVAAKMSEAIMFLNVIGKIKSETNVLLEQAWGGYLGDVEMPEVQLTLEKIWYKHDGDGWLKGCGEVYHYTNGGIVTAGNIDSKIFVDSLAENNVKMPAGKGAAENICGDPAEKTYNRVFAHKSPRVRKTDVLYGFISSWEDDCGGSEDPNKSGCLINKIQTVLDSVRGVLRYINNNVKQGATVKGDSTNKKPDSSFTFLDPTKTFGYIDAGIGVLKAFISFLESDDEFMGEHLFYAGRREIFGKYNKDKNEHFSNNVRYYWKVDLW